MPVVEGARQRGLPGPAEGSRKASRGGTMTVVSKVSGRVSREGIVNGVSKP